MAKKKKTVQSIKLFGIDITVRKATIVVFALAALLYANTLGHGYVQDDAIVISDNFLTQQGFEGIPGLLTNDTFFGFFKTEGKSRLVAGGRYRPLTPVMFAIEYQLFGGKPWAGHLINLLIYGLTGILIFRFLFWIGGNALTKPGHAMFFGLLGALLFIAHPVHTEAVANIKGRDEMMSFLLGMSAIYMTVRRQPRAKARVMDHALAALLFFLALLSKENAITLIAIVPVTLWFFTRQDWKSLLVATAPYLVAAAVFLVIRGSVIGWELGDPPRELLNNPFLKIVDGRYVDFSLSEKFATITFILGKYLQLLFFPYPLTHDYYPRHVDLMKWSDWQVLASLVAYAGLIAAAVFGTIKRRSYAYGIIFYLVTLSIVSNIVFPVGTNMSERFLYMPSLGWVIAICALITPIALNKPRIVQPIIALVIVTFSVMTVVRNPVWKSNYTLFLTDVETSKRSAKLLAAAGGELMAQKDEVPEGPLRQNRIKRALNYVIEAQEVHPNYKMSYLLRGNAHYYLGEWDAAIASYTRVLNMDQSSTEARNNLGIAYRDAGKYYGEQQQDYQRAVAYLSEAIKYIPEDYDALHSLGVAYGLSGQPMMALEMFRRGVAISPDNATAHFNLGLAYQQVGDVGNAQKHRDIAIQLDPEILQRRSNRQDQ